MAGFPYDYGDGLSVEEAKTNIIEHGKLVGMAVLSLVVTVVFNTAPTQAADCKADGLAQSLKSKSRPTRSPGPGPAPTTMGIPMPKTPLQRALNTGALGTAIGVLCVNAMWLPTPIGVGVCLAAVTGYVVPPAWTIIIRGIRAGNGG